MTDLVTRLRERAAAAREEGTVTALGDALHFEEAAGQIERDAGDAATIRGFINTHHMTPAMMASLMAHWQRRANESEGLLAHTVDDLMRANRRVEARDRRIARLMLAFDDARLQGLVLPGDLDPPVVLSGDAA
jgi:cytosine/adenosine deaminase-related metal-dependent hydrolase